MSVSAKRATMTTTLRAITAGKNWILANHESQWCSVPVKSRNNSVISTKTTAARIILIFFSILYLFSLLFTVYSHNHNAHLIEQPYRQSHHEERKCIRRRRDDSRHDEDRHDGMTAH